MANMLTEASQAFNTLSRNYPQFKNILDRCYNEIRNLEKESDLEAYDCPKANCLLWNGFEPLFDCGHHTHSHSHCPRVETYLFYHWMTCHS